ncbi:hypothetical protein HanOQP8_Chr12g0450401 [Helianthus annuus]|nr:hypothetical protein HanOQP8_Chr12g0450401 [Helianthus annuus]
MLCRNLTKRRHAWAALYLRVTCLWMVLSWAYWNQSQKVACIQANITRHGWLYLQQTSSNMLSNIVRDCTNTIT